MWHVKFLFFLLYFHFTLLIIMLTNDWFIIIGKNINHQKRHDSFSFLIQPGLRPSLCWIHHHCAAKKPNHFINKNHMLEMHYLCDQNQSWPSKKEPWLLLLNPCSITLSLYPPIEAEILTFITTYTSRYSIFLCISYTTQFAQFGFNFILFQLFWMFFLFA